MSLSFTVATYNVLCSAHIRPEHFVGVKPDLLRPEVREPLVIERVCGLRTKVICLQEVDYPLFARLEEALKPDGYRGRWAHKIRGKKEGVATFVHDAVDWERSSISGFAIDKDVALIASLSYGGLRFAVANAHLAYEPDSQAKRTRAQAAASLLASCTVISTPTVVCGDLNAEPHDDVLNVLRAGSYRDVHGRGYHTISVAGRTKKVDYLLCPPALEAWRFPLGSSAVGILPNEREPSDHVPLAALFRSAS